MSWSYEDALRAWRDSGESGPLSRDDYFKYFNNGSEIIIRDEPKNKSERNYTPSYRDPVKHKVWNTHRSYVIEDDDYKNSISKFITITQEDHCIENRYLRAGKVLELKTFNNHINDYRFPKFIRNKDRETNYLSFTLKEGQNKNYYGIELDMGDEPMTKERMEAVVEIILEEALKSMKELDKMVKTKMEEVRVVVEKNIK